MNQKFTQVGFTNDPKFCFPDLFCHELQMDSTAFVYQGLLYMISLANRLYLVNRKGEKQLFLKWIKYRYLFLTLHFSGVELIRELPYNDLKSNQRLDYGSYSEGIIMIDSENLIFCSRLLLVGCKTTFV